MLIDTHAHLFWDSFKEDFEQVIDNAKNAGIGIIINVGTDPETSQKAVQLKSDKIQFFSSIGIHPHEVLRYTQDKLDLDVSIQNDIERLSRVYKENRPKCIAVGECGLEYNSDKDYNNYKIHNYYKIQKYKIQKRLFQAQIELAKKLSLPLLIHCRDAWNDIFEDLNSTKGLFHTFTGSLDDLNKALSLGYYISFSCMITYPKNDSLREVVKKTPLDRILTETDSPFLPPQGSRGQRNEPANVTEVIRCLAEIKQLPTKELSLQIYQNAKRLFDF